MVNSLPPNFFDATKHELYFPSRMVFSSEVSLSSLSSLSSGLWLTCYVRHHPVPLRVSFSSTPGTAHPALVDTQAPLIDAIPRLRQALAAPPGVLIFFDNSSPSSTPLDENADLGPHRQLYASPLSALSMPTTQPDREGVLFKQSVKGGRATGTKRRWFSLFGRLLFYSPSKGAANSGCVPLAYYRVGPVQPQPRGKFESRLVPCTETWGEAACYVLSCEGEREMSDWMRALRARSASTARRVFGAPLLKLMPDEDAPLPPLLEAGLSFLREHALGLEGIFRQSGSTLEIQHLRDELDAGAPPAFSADTNPHNVAGLLKLWLREMPEPLLTFGLYSELLACVRDDRLELEHLRELVATLPRAHYRVLEALLDFLVEVVRMSDKNKMTAENMGTVLSPNLARTDSADPMTLVGDAHAVHRLLAVMIEHRDFVMPSPGAAELLLRMQKHKAELIALQNEMSALQSKLSLKKSVAVK